MTLESIAAALERRDEREEARLSEDHRPPILVVDDDPERLDALRRALRPEFDVHIAETVREALRVLRQRPVQVVLTDQRLDRMAGLELLRQVEEEWPAVVRVALTAYCDVPLMLEALRRGRIFRYLTKPWDAEELRAALHQACAQHAQLAEHERLLDLLDRYRARSRAPVEELWRQSPSTLAPCREATDGRAGLIAGSPLASEFDANSLPLLRQ